MGIFSGIGGVSISGNRADNIRDGEYLFTLDSAKAFVTRNDTDAVLLIFKVEEAEATSDVRPNRVGSKVRAFFPLDKTRAGKLTENGERWMGRLKTVLANILGGEDRVDEDGKPDPVTDEDVSLPVAASIIKGTEYRVNTLDPAKVPELMMEVATTPSVEGGLDMEPHVAEELIAAGLLNFADATGVKLRCEARTTTSEKSGKPFTNLYWAPAA